MEFIIGDRIRFKHDASEITVLVVRATLGHAGLLCVSECGKRVVWAQPEEVDLDHRPGPTAKEEVKQAVREVLLSEEFLAAFAAAWVKTPILHESELNLISGGVGDLTEAYNLNELAKQHQSPEVTLSNSTPDGWRELEPEETPKKGDLYWADTAWVKVLHNRAHEHKYQAEKFIRKIEG